MSHQLVSVPVLTDTSVTQWVPFISDLVTALIVYVKLEEKESADHLFVRLAHRPECVASYRPVLNVSALVNLVLQALVSVRQIISAWMNLSGVTVILFLTHALFY